MRFSPARFDALLNPVSGLGQSFGWRQAFACPCVNPNSGAAKPTCPLCFGKSWQWTAEVTSDCIAGMTAHSPGKGMAQFGSWEPGDATLTIPESSAFYGIGQYDRVRALNATHPFSLNIVPGMPARLLGSIIELTRVFWLSTDGTATIDGDIPTVGEGGALSWTMDQTAPPAATTYSVTGIRYEEFFVFQKLPGNRGMGGAALPKKLPVRVLDLFGRAG